jgi:hypothetical protein
MALFNSTLSYQYYTSLFGKSGNVVAAEVVAAGGLVVVGVVVV